MLNTLLINSGKLLSQTVKRLNLGHGSTWPGHIALTINPKFIRQLLNHSKTKVILVAGTNGKTTTSKLIAHILEKNGKQVLQNASGANLLNGIASTLILNAAGDGKLGHDYAIFEIDENTLPPMLQELTPDYVVLLNLFRDQLDRYGEVNTIAGKWREAITHLSKDVTLILNADDPQIAYLDYDKTLNTKFFSCKDLAKKSNKPQEHAVDSAYCPRCGTKLHFKTNTFSHLGDWSCEACKLKRPTPDVLDFPFYPLPGLYNKYNTNAAALLTKTLGFTDQTIIQALHDFKPAFGRQETITVDGKQLRIFLSKNPTGFNESLRTIKELGAKHMLLVLNDRIPDGKDVSWIWDTDLENLLDGTETITVSGDRVYDMALRVKHTKKFTFPSSKFIAHETLKEALKTSIHALQPNQTLYVLPTYTAMLEIRKIVTGRKIL